MEEDRSDDPGEPETKEVGCSPGALGCFVILLIVAGVGWWLWSGTGGNWLASEQAKEAEEAYGKGDYEVAETKLQELLEKHPNHPETLRATGRLLQTSEPFRAFLAMRLLHEMGEAEADDLRLFARLAQDVRKTHLSEAVTQKLIEQEPNNPDNMLLAARKLFLDFRWGEALIQVESILEAWPTHRSTRLLRGRLLTLRPELLPRLQGKTELKELVDEKERDRVSLEALIILAYSGLNPIEESERNATLRQIEYHPFASDSLKLRTFGHVHGPPSMDENTMERLLNRYGGKPELLGPWLAGRGRFKQAMNLFSLEQVAQKPELVDPWFAVLMHRSNMDRAERLMQTEEILSGAGGIIPEAQRVLLGAVLLREKGDRAGMRKLYNLALAEAKNLPVEKRMGFLDALARQSLASGERYLALQVLKERFGEGIGEDVPYEACERYFIVTVMNKQVAEALAIAKQVEQRFPAQFAARNNHAYLKLLLHQDVDDTARKVERLAGQGPPIPSFRTTLALARLRSGKPKEALQVIMLDDQLPAIYQGDGDKAVCSAVLWANDKKEVALELAKSIKRENLLPQEAALLDPVK